MHYKPEDFVVDGSLRDVCILDTEVVDWQRVVSAVLSSPWLHSFSSTLANQGPDISNDVAALFSELVLDVEASATLAIFVEPIWFTSYLFEVGEIEFTFDPADVSDVNSFSSLANFMKWLGGVSGRRVVMTMESTNHRSIPAILEYKPR